MAKVAKKIINMVSFRNIQADYAARDALELYNISLPRLIERRTFASSEQLPDSGPCAFCQRPYASMICEICFTAYCCSFYCSEDHQAKDWIRHKYDCKAMPKLISAEEANMIIDELKQSSENKAKYVAPHVEPPKKGDSVVITHALSGKVLYIRPLRDDYENLLAKVAENIEKTTFLFEAPEVNSTVLAPFNSTFHRAQIVDVFEPDQQGCVVLCLFIDIGVSAKFKWTSLKKLNYKTRGIPCQTFKVILKELNTSNAEAQSFVEELVEKREILEILDETRSDANIYVKLKSKNANQSINEIIMSMMSSTEEDSKDDPEGDSNLYDVSLHKLSLNTSNSAQKLFQEKKVQKLSEGENIKIRITDVADLANGFVSCVLAENYMKLWKIEKEVNDHGKSNAPTDSFIPK